MSTTRASLESIPVSRCEVTESDVAAVLETMRSQRLALGPQVREFERLCAEHAGCEHAIAVSSGTAGLHLLVLAAGIGAGDEVITTSFSFVASTNCFLYERAVPVFVDVEPETYTLDPTRIEEAITPRTKAILAVDVFGHPARWDEIHAVAERHGLTVIADPCESLGARYKGRAAGAEGIGGAYAFYPNKQITTGEGGMIVTHHADVAELCRSLRNQGRSAMGSWLSHERLGFNYRLDELSGALGVSQMRRLPELVAARAQVAAWYHEGLADLPIRLPTVRPEAEMSYFVYVVGLPEGVDRDDVMARLARRGIETRAYFEPIHRQPYIQAAFGDRIGPLPITEMLGRTMMALPFGSAIRKDEVDRVCEALREELAQ